MRKKLYFLTIFPTIDISHGLQWKRASNSMSSLINFSGVGLIFFPCLAPSLGHRPKENRMQCLQRISSISRETALPSIAGSVTIQ